MNKYKYLLLLQVWCQKLKKYCTVNIFFFFSRVFSLETVRGSEDSPLTVVKVVEPWLWDGGYGNLVATITFVLGGLWHSSRWTSHRGKHKVRRKRYHRKTPCWTVLHKQRSTMNYNGKSMENSETFRG